MARHILFCCLLWALPLALAAQSLRVGLSPDYPPLQYLHEGKMVGLEVDNAMAVSRILGRRLELVSMPFTELIPALLDGRIDVIMSGLSVTAERSTRVAFTEPHLEVGQMAIMHRDKVARFARPWSIYQEGVRLGVEPGTTGAAFAESELKDAEIRFFANPAAAFAALRADGIDLYIHDAPTSWQLANTSENDDLISLYAPLTREALAWAVRPDERELLLELNRALSQMEASGTLQYIRNRWIPVQVEVR
jgi:polar amino acid transport system substrate-binding protein